MLMYTLLISLYEIKFLIVIFYVPEPNRKIIIILFNCKEVE